MNGLAHRAKNCHTADDHGATLALQSYTQSTDDSLGERTDYFLLPSA